jgi:chitosanase
VPTPISADAERIIKMIINTFETGRPEGDYGAAALLHDNAGISYGRPQATDRGGNLDAIVYRYLDLGGGEYGDKLRPYLDRLETDDTARVDPDRPPQWVKDLMKLLSAAGEDPVMRQAQDQVFDEAYWVPAAQQAQAMGLELPLSWAVVYDSTIHSGPNDVPRIRRLFPEVPPSRGGDEKAWTRAYIAARYAWLASHPRHAVRLTVYRMRSLQALADADHWRLEPPVRLLKPRRVLT